MAAVISILIDPAKKLSISLLVYLQDISGAIQLLLAVILHQIRWREETANLAGHPGGQMRTRKKLKNNQLEES